MLPAGAGLLEVDQLGVADRRLRALAPEPAHLGLVVQLAVDDDRPHRLNELAVAEDINGRTLGKAASRAGAASAAEQSGEACRAVAVAIIGVGLVPVVLKIRHPLGAACPVP